MGFSVSELADRAGAEGVDLVGPGGLLTGLTKTVLETALEVEMSEHLGYGKHDPVGQGAGSGNSRNGTRVEPGDEHRERAVDPWLIAPSDHDRPRVSCG